MDPIPSNPPRWKPNPDPASIVVPGLDTTAPLLDQIEQMEQLITIKLQNVDENFSKISNLLENKILPAVKRYAVGTKPVKEAANFWVSFYEKAAQIRIPTFDDYSTVNEVPSERDELTSEAEFSETTGERTVRHDNHSVASTENSFMPGQAAFASTPATARVGHTMSTDDPSWSASLESPLARLHREVTNFSLEDNSVDSKLPSLRFNDPSVADDAVPRPRVDKGKGKDSAEPLLRNVLRNTLYSTSDVSFSSLSPTKGKLKTPVPNALNPYLPPDTAPANWSGLVDLRHTPLSTPLRKKHGRHDESDDDSFDGLPAGMSPPVLMSPAKPPRSSAELQLLRGKTPAKVAASRIKNDLVRDVQRQNSAKARKVHGYALSGGESSMSTVSSPPSLSRYNRHDTDESAVDESLESVMQRVALNPPTWTPTASTPGLRLRPKASAFRADPIPAPTYLAPPEQYQPHPAADDIEFSPPVTPHHYDDGGDGGFDSDSDSLDNEVNNTAHPSAAFLMATQAASGSSGSFDEDDSQDSLEQADVGALDEGVVDVHPFARSGYATAYTGDDSFDDETFDAGVPEETVFGRAPAQRAQARLSEQGELLMYGDDEASGPDTIQYGMAASSPTPHWQANARG
ncbi:DASH complex subunit Ask1-domain-containing protein [Mycena metata]|uniref:DASH complex subunit ASK1 n=1 Tax=Mycena metata TaxID=1033252 RepID=A0AAD7I9D3_9AGAR|nr:DASH complex subunit Ask1-domain-containing protein [Mycena metata]